MKLEANEPVGDFLNPRNARCEAGEDGGIGKREFVQRVAELYQTALRQQQQRARHTLEGTGPKQGFAHLHEWSDWFGRHFRKDEWGVCTPETVRDLSAIGYVFARRVHKAANVPIGVIDASRGGTTVETWTPLAVLRALDSEPTRAKLPSFDDAVAQWDPQAELEQRIADHRQWIERQTKEGKPIFEDRRQPPSDPRPGPIGNHNYPGHCYAGMIAPLAGAGGTPDS